MAKIKKFNNELSTLFYINIAVLILVLSAFNLAFSREEHIQVLGSETDNVFWEEMVAKHPTYRDAWIELGRMDKVKQIDPNYLQP